jgi:hypothetical protein
VRFTLIKVKKSKITAEKEFSNIKCQHLQPLPHASPAGFAVVIFYKQMLVFRKADTGVVCKCCHLKF